MPTASDSLCCPQCGKDYVQRSHRRGVLELLLSLAYVYPFRCQLCSHRFRVMRFGTHYFRQRVDRRDFRRVAFRCTAKFTTPRGGAHVGVVTDLSVVGCSLEAECDLQRGEVISMVLYLNETRTVTIESAVARSVRGRFMGLEFLRIGDDQQQRLSQFMQALLSASSA